jgi:Asp-tRNA(Asn)/Glu-tRNA(Gln) amidotransferase B subunit
MGKRKITVKKTNKYGQEKTYEYEYLVLTKGYKTNISREIVDNIIQEYFSSPKTSYRNLAKKHGVSHEWIRKIVQGEGRKFI